VFSPDLDSLLQKPEYPDPDNCTRRPDPDSKIQQITLHHYYQQLVIVYSAVCMYVSILYVLRITIIVFGTRSVKPANQNFYRSRFVPRQPDLPIINTGILDITEQCEVQSYRCSGPQSGIRVITTYLITKTLQSHAGTFLINLPKMSFGILCPSMEGVSLKKYINSLEKVQHQTTYHTN